MIINVVGTQKDTSKKAVELAETHKNIYATIGLHPIHLFPTRVDEEESSFKSREEDFDEEFYGELVKSKKVIAVGETGIDLFHMPKEVAKEVVLKKQKEVFLKHMFFAQKYHLPLVIHVRDAHEEFLNILGDIEDIRGVVHCFTSDWHHAQKYLDRGLYLGFTGVVTFPPKKTDPKLQEDLLEVIARCPLNRMLVETDAPYLAPQKYRGERCEPWMTEEVIKKIAEIRQKTYEEVRHQTSLNSQELFTRLNLKNS